MPAMIQLGFSPILKKPKILFKPAPEPVAQVVPTTQGNQKREEKYVEQIEVNPTPPSITVDTAGAMNNNVSYYGDEGMVSDEPFDREQTEALLSALEDMKRDLLRENYNEDEAFVVLYGKERQDEQIQRVQEELSAKRPSPGAPIFVQSPMNSSYTDTASNIRRSRVSPQYQSSSDSNGIRLSTRADTRDSIRRSISGQAPPPQFKNYAKDIVYIDLNDITESIGGTGNWMGESVSRLNLVSAKPSTTRSPSSAQIGTNDEFLAPSTAFTVKNVLNILATTWQDIQDTK